MTEAEWLACSDPRPLLEFIRRTASDRKLRLLGVAICRQFREQLDIEALPEALEAAERYADTRETKAGLKRARQGVKTIRHGISSDDKARVVEWVALWLSEVAASENAFRGVGYEVIRFASQGLIGPDAPTLLVKVTRHIFGPLPFRQILAGPLSSTPAIIRLAQRIYDERAFQLMPELADALEAAGCTNAELLDHCHGPELHVRGCWALDLILGKE